MDDAPHNVSAFLSFFSRLTSSIFLHIHQAFLHYFTSKETKKEQTDHYDDKGTSVAAEQKSERRVQEEKFLCLVLKHLLMWGIKFVFSNEKWSQHVAYLHAHNSSSSRQIDLLKIQLCTVLHVVSDALIIWNWVQFILMIFSSSSHIMLSLCDWVVNFGN